MTNKLPITITGYVFLSEIELESKIKHAVEKAVSNFHKVSPILSKEILRVSDASTLLGLHTSTIYRYVRNNQIPYVKRNGTVWLLRSQLDKWITDSSGNSRLPIVERLVMMNQPFTKYRK